jgi:hypothetical protein
MTTPDRPLSEILFYQPTVTVDQQEETSAITHSFMRSKRSNLLWPPLGRVSFDIPVGLVSNQPSSLQLHIGDKVITVEDYYLYQSGHYYVQLKKENGSESGYVSKRASGVFIHAVSTTISFLRVFSPTR